MEKCSGPLSRIYAGVRLGEKGKRNTLGCKKGVIGVDRGVRVRTRSGSNQQAVSPALGINDSIIWGWQGESEDEQRSKRPRACYFESPRVRALSHTSNTAEGKERER
ncbi:hypothetical protein An16g08750 [Aspergillus niger]|uniref:Uncharacterized protein n=2 Tax=Aspergillus niger TaxID=5061 RepID=A2R8Y1_ASPNC|nr:hypothetical protein An16g08750 [Aspergillus niger]CAK42974.1 hypothetical protein An16g08750 [Aspergillus niger]